MNYEEILQTVRGFCAREKLLDGKKHLALAVSGGADSMALLLLLRALQPEFGYFRCRRYHIRSAEHLSDQKHGVRRLPDNPDYFPYHAEYGNRSA